METSEGSEAGSNGKINPSSPTMHDGGKLIVSPILPLNEPYQPQQKPQDKCDRIKFIVIEPKDKGDKVLIRDAKEKKIKGSNKIRINQQNT